MEPTENRPLSPAMVSLIEAEFAAIKAEAESLSDDNKELSRLRGESIAKAIGFEIEAKTLREQLAHAARMGLEAERECHALREQVAELAGALRIISDETEDSTAEYAAKVARTVLDKVAL